MQINTNNVSKVMNQVQQPKNQETAVVETKQAVNENEKNIKQPSGELLRAYVGLNVENKQIENTSQTEEPKEMTAYEYLCSLPNVKNSFKNELKEVAKVMERMDVESSNVDMMVQLVADGKLWKGVLRYFCEHGKMSKPMENDIDTLYGAYGDCVNPLDRDVLTVESKQAGMLSSRVGDVFEIEGEKNIYIKNSDEDAQQLKISKEMFGKLFPLAERFSSVQGAAGDCYLLATLNSIIENPSQRHVLYGMFEETEDSIKVKMPNGEAEYEVPKDDLRQGMDRWQHLQGAPGMVLAEHVYGEELKTQYEKSFYKLMNDEIARLENEEPQNTEKIEGYKQRVADFTQKNQDADFKPVLMRFENPDAKGKLTFKYDENGIMFKDLASSNKELKRKLPTQADFYRGSIGGDLDVVMKDFGYNDIKEFKTNDKAQEQEIKELLFSKEGKENYIFTAGALSDGTLQEKPLAKDYSVYSCHAYKIAPFTDKDGSTKFYVENPWNATQNSIMEYDKLKEFFEVICAVKGQ